MKEYRQLTEEGRIEIYAMKQAGKEQTRLPLDWAYIPALSAGNWLVIPACVAIALSRPSKRLYIEGLRPAKRLR